MIQPSSSSAPRSGAQGPGRHAADGPSHDLLDGLTVGFCLLDADTRVVFMNAHAGRLLGCHPDTARGHLLSRFVEEELDTRLPAPSSVSVQWRERLAIAGKEHGLFMSRSGRSVQIEWTHGASGTFDGAAVALTLRDVTRELQLEDDRNRLAAIAEESPYPVVELDRHAQMLYANPVMIDLLARFGFNDQGWSDIFPRRLSSLVDQCLATGQRLSVQEVTAGDACFAWTFCPVEPHRHVRGYAIDMTEIHAAHRILNQTADHLRESNRQLDQALQQAQAATRAKTSFLATISHELRTPMNGVIGMTSLLLETTLTVEQRSLVQTIQQCGETQLSLINDVLDCSKIEAGRFEIECIDFHLRKTVEDVLGQFAERAQAKGLEITGLVHASVPVALRGDPSRLRQILVNFLANAIKFTEQGEVTLEASVDREEPDTVTIRFEITDTGIGISPDTQARLFQPFMQADSSTTRKYGGTGLGLSISKQLAELMGGHVGLRSTPGQGSTFWCTVPLAKQPHSPLAIVPMTDLVDRRVLLIDANRSSRTHLKALTGGWGMQAEPAHDTSTALACIEQASANGRPYDVAVFDISQQGQDGLEWATQLRTHPAGTGLPLVLLTSLIHTGQAEEARQAGFPVNLTKPVRHDALQCGLRIALGFAREPESANSAHGLSIAIPLAHPPQGLPADQPRILVAEDNIVNQHLTVRMLERLGYQPDVVGNGRDVLKALESNTYAAILMDCQMPELDGYEATRLIRLRERSAAAGNTTSSGVPDRAGHLPIIALTANAMKEDRNRCQAAGMDDYLSKPITTQRLGAMLARWVPAAEAAASHALETVSNHATNPSNPPFDAARMLANIGGDLVLQKQLLQLFMERHQMMLRDIADALTLGDGRKLEHAAHTMKGTAGNLCATDLATVASQLETVGRGGDLAQGPRLYASLEREVRALAQAITDNDTPPTPA